MPGPDPHFLYEQIATALARDIDAGHYAPGERLPSLRRLSEDFAVSMATAVQACQHLEQQGRIEARPRSGFFVCPETAPMPAAPATSRPRAAPATVSVGHLAMSLVHESRHSGLIRLGAAVPEPGLQPLGTLSRILAGISRRHPRAAAGYEDSAGHPDLRRRIVHLMREAGVRCAAEDIIITNGCLEALGLALRAVARPGATIAVESPTYFGVLQVIESLHMKALELPTDAATGIDLTALEAAIGKRSISACVLMPSYNNPLGSAMPDDHKAALVRLLRRHRIPLIEDDVYGPLSHAPKRPRAAKAWDEDGDVLYCSSFSKTVAPGLRIGWVVPGRYLEQVRYQKFLDNISTAIHPQLALAEFLSRDAWKRTLRHSARIYRQRLDQLLRLIGEHFPAGTRVSNPQGGFLLWVELPKHIDCLALYRKALEKRISITPGVLFTAQQQYKHHIRLSVAGVEEGKLRASVISLAGVIASLE